MDWTESLDYVLVWFRYIFDWCFSFFARFDGYISLILVFFALYFLFNKLLTPIFDGELPEGKGETEAQLYAKLRNKKKDG